MPGQNDSERREQSVPTDDLAFVAFALTHSPCGDVIELRLERGALIQWCVACSDARVFCAAGP